MKRITTLFIHALLLLSLTGCNPFSSGGSSGPKGPITVLALGDSNTGDVNYPGVQPWPYHLQAMEPEWTVINAGIGGERAAGGRARVNGLLNRHDPDVLVVMYGSNNAIQGDTASYKEDMRAIIRAAKSRNITVVVGNILPISGGRAIFQSRVDSLNQILVELTREEQVRLVNVNREFRGSAQTERFPDGLHPDADGMRILAMAFREGIRKAYRPRPAAE